MLKPIKLTKSDWLEISAALRTKRDQIANGDFGEGTPKDPNDNNDIWMAQLTRVMWKIGDDGAKAYRQGVAPHDPV
jgi:hypothetical protein